MAHVNSINSSTMEKVTVHFDFETVKEWVEFYNKIKTHQDLMNHCPAYQISIKNNKSLDEVFNNVDNISPTTIFGIISIQTKSKKILSSLNEFLKENHWENNYRIWGSHRGSAYKMHLDLDDLLERAQ